jgi:uroporphyrinogen-III synthase
VSAAGSRPLVVVTREESVDDGLSRALLGWGAEPLALQTVATAPPEDLAPLVAAVEDLARYDWILFTSARAADAVCTQPAWNARGLPKIAAVGPRTADRLDSYGVKADVVPALAGAAALVAALEERAGELRGARVLWPRSAIAATGVAEALSAAGAYVDAPTAYRTVLVRPAGIEGFLRDLEAGRIAAIAFLSPSSARGLAAALPGNALDALRRRTLVASLGPTTSAALRELGAPAEVEPATRSAAALAEAICSTLAARSQQT